MLRRHPILTALVATPLVLALGLVGLGAWWLRDGRLPLAAGATWMTVQKTAASDATSRPDAPVFLLAVGTDARLGETVARGDAIHVIGVNPATGTGTILDIPRDTGASIPGQGVDKINAAMSAGGPELLAQTVSNFVGVPISYVITTNFDGFMGMVDELGGVTVNVQQRNVDSFSGANFEVGPIHMNGRQALAFSRNRHGFPTGDLQRSENQGYFILQALTQLRSQNPGPVATLGLLGNLGRHARLVNLGWADAYRLGRLGLSLDPANVKNVRIPVASGVGTRLALQPSGAALFADFRDDATLQNH
jgi:LCP family protein required for cell wall assembly